ncbi:hypothetical protein EOE18_13695 [Novosphingobium umbonatum]|uniref:Zinc finger Ogr/Delta-type domain-containing protein n=1 Tax=Novosphingobium umbonatum TaxID=1908524 RepID=A0A3S2UQW8_9SPHN|nr:ogr/Delta-like zinc finger family protein [Novosphingobium umbonatum]RVU03908.1 hypothetical protein EOE18_13695 [Novosphingobium umbonatum]
MMHQIPTIKLEMLSAALQFRLRNGGSQSRAAMITCPICSAPAFIRRSERLSETTKLLGAHCTNTGCGATAEWVISLKWMVNPGLIDRSDLDLPRCPPERITQVFPPDPEEDTNQLSMFPEE